jgi:pimeloyl-ACP methyl ester carboxylesterase
MFPGAPPADYDAYQKALMTSLARPGAWRALQQTTRTSHQPAEDNLQRVSVPTLVVMGAEDPDFKSPADEAAFVAGELHGDVVLVPDAGHYPQAESPEVVGKSITAFLQDVVRG